MPTMFPITGTLGPTFELGGNRTGKPSLQVAVGDFRLSDHIERSEWRSIRSRALAAGYILRLGGIADEANENETPQHPAISLSGFDAKAWANALSQDQGLEPRYVLRNGALFAGAGRRVFEVVRLVAGSGYRLPTSAEHEYAAREGGVRPGNEWSGAHGALTRDDVANVAIAYPYIEGGPGEMDIIWGARGAPQIRPVGTFVPNALGLHDVSGNVHCWTGTFWGGTEYDGDDSRHLWRLRQSIVRGGAATGSDANLRPNERLAVDLMGHMPNLGLRVVLDGLV